MVRDACGELGLKPTSSVYGNEDTQARQMLALLQRAGSVLVRKRNTFGGGWLVLERVHEFETTPGTAEYDLPEDYGRIITDTAWDRSNFWQIRGPRSPQEWQGSRSGLLSSQFRQDYRIRRAAAGRPVKKFVLYPTPVRADTLVFEYVTHHYIEASDGQIATKYTSDADNAILDEDLLVMSLVWRWRKAKSLEYLADMMEFDNEVSERMGIDTGAEAISLVPEVRAALGRGTVPETGFGEG